MDENVVNSDEQFSWMDPEMKSHMEQTLSPEEMAKMDKAARGMLRGRSMMTRAIRKALDNAKDERTLSSKQIQKALKTPKLKPCPFCGGKPSIMEEPDHQGFLVGFSVRCNDCEAQTQVFESSDIWVEISENVFTTTNDLRAAGAWNQRPGEKPKACPKCGIAKSHKHVKREGGGFLVEFV